MFRRDNKNDAFQKQISALRQQLGNDPESDEAGYDPDPDEEFQPPEAVTPTPPGRGYAPPGRRDRGYGYPGLEATDSDDEEADVEPAAGSPVAVAAPSLPEPIAPAMPVLPSAGDGRASVVSHDTSWTGDLNSDGSVHVYGKVEGNITAKDDVFVAEHAEVDATIAAANVIVAGEMKGTVRASARFEVLPEGRVSGDVHAPTLIVHQGAVISGQLRMSSSEAVEAPTSGVASGATSGVAPGATSETAQRRSLRGGARR